MNAQFSAPDTAFITAATGFSALAVGAVTFGVSRFVVAATGVGDAVTALAVTFMTVGATLTGLGGAAVCRPASGLTAAVGSGVTRGCFGVFGPAAAGVASLALLFFCWFARSRPLPGALAGLSVLGSGGVWGLGSDALSSVVPAAGVPVLSSSFLGRGLSRRGLVGLPDVPDAPAVSPVADAAAGPADAPVSVWSAHAAPCPDAIAVPMPSATASLPTRPM